MRYEPIPPERTIAMDPITVGFGFVVLEHEPVQLIDWGTVHRRRTAESLGRAVQSMLARYRPTHLVIEDPSTSRSYTRRRALGDAVAVIADAADGICPMTLIARSAVSSVLATLGAVNKRQAVKLLVERFPELVPRIPPPRFLWQREDPRWAIFDALALALAAMHTVTAAAKRHQGSPSSG